MHIALRYSHSGFQQQLQNKCTTKTVQATQDTNPQRCRTSGQRQHKTRQSKLTLEQGHVPVASRKQKKVCSGYALSTTKFATQAIGDNPQRCHSLGQLYNRRLLHMITESHHQGPCGGTSAPPGLPLTTCYLPWNFKVPYTFLLFPQLWGRDLKL